jgi:DNA (cytosine-5)-methyltransferase 1
VDERDIQDVTAADLHGFTQCHFFAGIGGWSYALRVAGWDDDRPVWTGSCPCQPFSAAGKGGGTDDVRHLWPDFFRLIRECRPSTILGEQVASPAGLAWFDLVSTDLEGEDYAVGAVDCGAAGVGAPHLRQRLWFVANAESSNGQVSVCERRPQQAVSESGRASGTSELGHADAAGPQGRGKRRDGADQCVAWPPGMADVELAQSDEGRRGEDGFTGSGDEDGRYWIVGSHDRSAVADPSASFWSDNLEWIPCRDGKWRPTQPGLFPLAHGVPNRVGTLRGAGNAIVPQVAAEVIRAYMETQ